MVKTRVYIGFDSDTESIVSAYDWSRLIGVAGPLTSVMLSTVLLKASWWNAPGVIVGDYSTVNNPVIDVI